MIKDCTEYVHTHKTLQSSGQEQFQVLFIVFLWTVTYLQELEKKHYSPEYRHTFLSRHLQCTFDFLTEQCNWSELFSNVHCKCLLRKVCRYSGGNVSFPVLEDMSQFRERTFKVLATVLVPIIARSCQSVHTLYSLCAWQHGYSVQSLCMTTRGVNFAKNDSGTLSMYIILLN